MTKLTHDEIYEIKRLLAEENASLTELAFRHNVRENTIYLIRSLRSNKDIAPEYNERLRKINHSRKLSVEDIYEIKKHLSEGNISGKDIAGMYNVSPLHITHIKTLRSHKDIAPEFNDRLVENIGNIKLTAEKVREIRASHPELSYNVLSKKYDVSEKTIKLIIHRKIWKDVE